MSERYFLFFYQLNNGESIANGVSGYHDKKIPSFKKMVKLIANGVDGFHEGNVLITSFKEVTLADYVDFLTLSEQG